MLQQTQVTSVLAHYERFLDRFPTLESLAGSTEDEVLHAWIGLGYYRRAIRLREAAQQVLGRFNGEVPQSVDELCSLPGIGRSTAGGIVSSAFGIPAPILDANVKRVLARFHGVNGPEDTRISESKLWSLAEQHTPKTHAAAYTQAIMDFGARHCSRSQPRCTECDLSTRCVAHRLNAVNLYPAPSVPKKRVDVLKRQLVVLDCDGACLLEQQDDSGTYARLWEPLSLSTGTEPVRLLESLGLPTDSATIADCPPMEPYEISNQRVTEEVVVAKFREDSTRLCTPPNTRWYIDDELTPLGMSIRTRKRLDLAKSQVTFS